MNIIKAAIFILLVFVLVYNPSAIGSTVAKVINGFTSTFNGDNNG